MKLYKLILLLLMCAGLQADAQIVKIKNSNKTNTEKTAKMKIDIWSDVLCPFCYIGKRKFEAALAQFPEKDKVEVEWHSFQLDPDAVPQPGVDMYDYLAKRKGMTREWSIDAHKYVTNMAKEAGLTYNFDEAVVSNSFDAHRLIQFAKKHGKDDEVEELLFKAHFTEGKNTGDKEVLAQLGKEAGLNEQEVRDMLNSDAYGDDVRKDSAAGEQVGLTGVPFFVIDNKYGISGAQQTELFLKVLKQAYEERK
jgi:predicted DsbA family dithiol-disulfide isomerase